MWIPGRQYALKYKREDEVCRTYYPDFFLPETREFIEIKGFFRECDKEKMKLVIEQNNDRVIKILFQNDIMEL